MSNPNNIQNMLLLSSALKVAQNNNVDPNVSNLVVNLQSIIIKQQDALKKLITIYDQVQKNGGSENHPITEENKASHDQIHDEREQGASQPEDEDEESSTQPHGILKRNGFRPQNKPVPTPFDDLEDGGSPSRGGKDKPSSKAKHLWINYGRKIVEYAINHTQGEVQNRVKQFVGKLTSKKDYGDVFGIKAGDSDDDKLFKTLFGRIAVFFIKFKAESAFNGSKYKDQMITQKHVVKNWIEQLIGA